MDFDLPGQFYYKIVICTVLRDMKNYILASRNAGKVIEWKGWINLDNMKKKAIFYCEDFRKTGARSKFNIFSLLITSNVLPQMG